MKRRKIFSLVLAGVMLFSNITSFAAETTETTEVSNTEITTESVTTEEISVDEAETTTIEISDETSSINETTETSEVTIEEDTTEEATTGFVKFSVSYDTLLSDVSFSVYDSNETQVAVYIVSDAKVSFIDLLVDKDILYEQDEETLLSLENGDYYLSMDETVYDGDSTPSDAGVVYDDSMVEFTINSEDLNSPLEVEVSLEELVIEETEETTETTETSESTTDDTVATPSDITEDITYVTAASETENAVSSEGIVLVTGTFGSLTAASAEVSSDTESSETEDAEIIVFDHYYSEIDESLVETTDLIVTTSDESIFTKNTNVISNYDNAYIISCETVEEARYVYSYYVDKVDTISDLSKNISVATDDSEDVADLSDINNDDDALSTLNDIDTKSYKGYIALIDTGADADVNFSVIGDDTSDTNGHGTKMLNLIKENNPDAKVLSIKVSEGSKTDAASIYAGIMLAIESKVSVINLSMVGYDTESNAIVKEAIEEAIASGITVIGAAGNYNLSAKKFIPGSISGAIIVGAANEDGTKYSKSNYDADVYVVATSTSEATAIYTGLYTAEQLDDERIYTSLVTETAEEEDDEDTTETEVSEGTDEYIDAMSDIYGKEFDVPDSDLKYIINEDGSVTFIVDADYFETAVSSSDAVTSLGEVDYSVFPTSSSLVEYGKCTLSTANSNGSGSVKASSFTHTSGSTIFTDIIDSSGYTGAIDFVCARHWNTESGDSKSHHAKAQSSGTKYYKASIYSLDTTPDSNGKVYVTFEIKMSDRSDLSDPEWVSDGTTVYWNVSSSYVGTNTYNVVASVNGSTVYNSNVGASTMDVANVTNILTSYISSAVSTQAEASANDDSLEGIRNFDDSNLNSNTIYSIVSGVIGATTSGGSSVYFSWESTTDTQVYKAHVSAWAYANIELTLTKALSSTGDDFIDYCEDLGLDYYSLVGTKLEVYTDSSCSTHLKDVDGNNVTFTITSEGTLSKTFEIGASYAGKTVYIKETGVGTGYKYNSSYISGKSYTLPDAGESAEVTIANAPMYDPFQWNLQKVSDVSGSTDWSGEINAVSATYKITGYKLTSSNGKGTQFGTWYAKTDSDGKIKFTDSSYYTSDSDELYIESGQVYFPIGYYTIEETAVEVSSGIEVSSKTYTYIISASSDSTGTDCVLKDGSTVIYQRTVSNSTATATRNSSYMITLADGSTTLGTNTSGSFLVIDEEEWAKLGLFKTDEVYIEEGYTANNSVLKEDNAGTSFSGAVFNIYVDASKVSGFSASSFFTSKYDNHTYSLTKVSSVTVSDQLGNSKTINVSNLYQIYVDGSPLTITTNSTGSGVTDYKLPYSVGYVAYEVEAPEGFVCC